MGSPVVTIHEIFLKSQAEVAYLHPKRIFCSLTLSVKALISAEVQIPLGSGEHVQVLTHLHRLKAQEAGGRETKIC